MKPAVKIVFFGLFVVTQRDLSAAVARSMHSQPSPPSAGPPSGTVDASDVVLVRDVTAERMARSAACKRLLVLSDSASRRAVAELLGPSIPLETQDLVLNQVGELTPSPVWIVPVLADCLKACAPERRPALITVVGTIRSREAIRLLLVWCADSALPPERQAAFDGLIHCTGQTELGTSAAAWGEWFARVQWLPEPEWREMLADGLARRADVLESDRARLIDRLVESERKRFLLAPVDERSGLVAGLLRDDLPRLRRLGIELANRELANARLPDGGVGSAALGLLKDPLPEVRMAAADLVDRLVPADAGAAVNEAFAQERDPAVAPALLNLCKRWPMGASREIILGWLEISGPPRQSALEALAVFFDRGLLSRPEDQGRVLRAAHAAGVGELLPGALHLLCELGSDQDREQVGAMLITGTPVQQVRAAEALESRADQLDRVLSAASANAALFHSAVAAVEAHRAVAAGFLSVLELPAPVAEAKRSALLRLSEQLEPGDAVVAARAIGDLSLREAVLARFEAQYSQASPFAFGRSGIGPTRIGVLLLLAQTRLEMENSAAYLKTIDLLGSIEGRVDPALLRRLRVIALICLNRLDEVFDIDPTPDDWLDGLAHALRLPQATMVANEIQGRFGATLTDGQRKRLELLTQRAKAGTAVLQGTGPSTQR